MMSKAKYMSGIIVLLGMVFISSCVKKEVKKDNIVKPDDQTEKIEVVSTSTSPVSMEVLEDTTTEEADVRKEEIMPLDTVYFDFDRYDVLQDAKKTLLKNAKNIIANNYTITVEGHCDERGTNQYNLSLGQKRANSLKDYYILMGVPESRIATISYGEENPVCTESTEECWAKNRRAETKVTK
ncbi:MAG: peptidoglycan-associated lipoprotein Pal [Elusimicrobiales bacterium]|jgi:peptidoglycan-associated lipoprotein|nr:peptidoglycan-associated lipoprotein Pal [Elusimicrobiales bacterium]NLH39235.1 peptidoglycan-associated lipoprotein Pal [Elusimicrobiota bacterium]